MSESPLSDIETNYQETNNKTYNHEHSSVDTNLNLEIVKLAVEACVTEACSLILTDSPGFTLKAVELANSLRLSIGTDIMSFVREKLGGLLTLLEKSPSIMRVQRIPKSDIITLITPTAHKISLKCDLTENWLLVITQNYDEFKYEMNYDNVISTLESALTPTFFVTYPQYTPLLYYVRVVILKTFKKSPFLCKSSEAPLPPSRCLHIGNVPVNINENQLLTELEEFGEVETLRIISQKNRRFAFVTYSSLELAVSAKQAIIEKQRKSHVQSWKSAVSFAHQESFAMHPHKARTPTLEPNPSSLASMASGYTTASSVGSVYPHQGPAHTGFSGYGEQRARDQLNTSYHPHSISSKSGSSTDSVAYTPRSTADGHDNSFSQPKQMNSYISQFDTRAPYGSAPPGFSNQSNSLFASSMPYGLASHNSLSSLPSPPRYQPQAYTPKGYDKQHTNQYPDSSIKSRSYSGSSLSSPSASPSLWAQCPVLRYLCDSSYHANQSWPCCLTIDSSYCDLLASVLRRQGGRMYIRELAEHLQRELNITQAIAGIPLKSFLIAYPSRFLVQGDFVIDTVSLSFLQQQHQQQVSPNKDSSSITALPPSLFQSERSQNAQSNHFTASFPMSVIHRPTPVYNRPATVFSALTQGTDSGPYSPPSYNSACTPITAMHPQHPSFAGDAGHLKGIEKMLEFMDDEFFI